jgi:restriction system protein
MGELMARNSKSPLEDVIDLSSRLSWKITISFAVIAYIALHLAAQIKLQHPAGIGTVGSFAVKQMLITMAMFGQYVLPGVFLIAAIASFFRSKKQERLFHSVAGRQKVGVLTNMSWRDFEMMIGEYFRRSGFKVLPTPEGPDGGVDIKLTMSGETYLVQCKQWRAYKVGVQPVREFYGVMTAAGAVGGYFVTSGEFTDEAVKFADGSNLRLFDGRKLLRIFNDQCVAERVGFDATPVIQVEAAPVCPKCGERMVRRVARKGANAGGEFWGCVGFPQCNGVRAC